MIVDYRYCSYDGVCVWCGRYEHHKRIVMGFCPSCLLDMKMRVASVFGESRLEDDT